MKSKRLCTLLVLIIAIESSYAAIESIDTLDPIIRRSPAINERDDDLFGFSFAIHQNFSNPDGLTGEEALNQTVVMIGAPKGEFPGGLTGLTPNGLACRENRTTGNIPFQDDAVLEALTDPDEIWPCYKGRQWGLVYQCSLHEDECIAPVGDGDPVSNDGLLFDRVGNTRTTNLGSGMLGVFQYKDTQLMGFSMFSTGDYFMACAPRWEEVSYSSENDAEPKGRCIYSDRTLRDFKILFPCPAQGATGRQTNGGYCQSGIGSVITNTTDSKMFIGSVGFDFSKGILHEYDDLSNPILTAHETSGQYVESASDNDDARNANFGVQSSYYGYYLTTGSITATDSVDLISTSIRFPGIGQAGRVSIVESVTVTPTMFVDGDQFGEYFGMSVAAVDLNGDGFDDLVVGAPLYSTTGNAEIGRIAIYKNQAGMLTNNSITIPGTVPRGRFGYSVTRMGDLNNDGYEDFAVSAPFEDSGVVYIYHGQADIDSIVNQQDMYQQKIEGKDFLSGAALFGSTIQALVDIDLNQYKDLVVGAPGGQAVVVLRTRPVAQMSFTVVSVDEIFLDPPTPSCLDTSGSAVPCFEVRVCAQYNGRGVDSLSAQFKASEMLTTSRRRLFFINGGEEEFSTFRNLMLTGENIESCDNFTVYVSDTSGRNINDFEVQVEFIQPDVTSANSLITPVLDFDAQTLNVGVAAECGDDEICDSDLFLELENIVYFRIGSTRAERQTGLIANGVSEMSVNLRYGNTGETAFTANITFSLPPTLQFIDVTPTTLGIICEANNTGFLTAYTCDVVVSVNTDGSSLQLRWRPSQDIRGNESDISVPISINIDQQLRNREMNDRLGNNVQTAEIPVLAVIEYSVGITLTGSTIRYNGDDRPDITDTSDLGRELGIVVTIRNTGPSIVYNGIAEVFIPTRAAETGDYFYYYPSSLAILGSDNVEIVCNQSVINPSGFEVGRRRRRSAIGPKSVYSHITSGLSRMARQSSEFTLDCQEDPEACSLLRCSVTDFQGEFTLSIAGRLDERFYYQKDDEYDLRVFARFSVLDDFIDIDANSTREATADISIVPTAIDSGISSGDLALIIVLPIVGVAFIVILAVALYCFGFFRRKKHDKGEDANEEFEAFDENAFSAKAAKKEKELDAAK